MPIWKVNKAVLEWRKKENVAMGVDLIFRIAAIGILVSILNQVLIRSGREEQAMLTTLAGLVVVLMMVIKEIVNLFDTVKAIFQF
jgi:stage III sporulation protein AC